MDTYQNDMKSFCLQFDTEEKNEQRCEAQRKKRPRFCKSRIDWEKIAVECGYVQNIIRHEVQQKGLKSNMNWGQCEICEKYNYIMERNNCSWNNMCDKHKINICGNGCKKLCNKCIKENYKIEYCNVGIEYKKRLRRLIELMSDRRIIPCIRCNDDVELSMVEQVKSRKKYFIHPITYEEYYEWKIC